MRKTRIRTSIGFAALGVLATLLTGCAATDPSPQMIALGRSDAEINQDHAISSDENIRALIDDLDRFLLIDRPSRLTPGISPH